MNNGKLVALGLVGGGVFYLWKTGAFDALFGSTVAPTAQQMNDAIFRSLSPENQRYVIAQTEAAISLQATQNKELIDAQMRSPAGALVYATAGASAAAGIVGSLVSANVIGLGGFLGGAALTGYAAAGALLYWGIAKKGWFRGGEEGVYVNPARDDFTDVWVCVFFGDPKSFTRAEIQKVRYEAMVKSFVDAGVPNEFISPTIGQLYAADTMKEFETAAYNYLDVLKTRGSNINWINAPADTPMICVPRTA